VIRVKHLGSFDTDKRRDLVEAFIVKAKLPVHLSNAKLKPFIHSKIPPCVAHFDYFVGVGKVEEVRYF
jgi:hypothetical protein